MSILQQELARQLARRDEEIARINRELAARQAERRVSAAADESRVGRTLRCVVV